MSDPNIPDAQSYQSQKHDYVPVDYAPTRPTSVTVLSIIGIVIAALSLICLPTSVLPFFVPAMQQNNPGIGAIKASPALFGWTLGSAATGILMSLLLLVGSIGALRLIRWARPAMLAYAVLSILMSIVTMVVQLAFVLPVSLAPQNLPPGTPASAMGMVRGIAYGSTILFSLIFMALPTMILIFFRKPHVVDAFERRITL